VHLRMCMECGKVGGCDDAASRRASSYAREMLAAIGMERSPSAAATAAGDGWTGAQAHGRDARRARRPSGAHRRARTRRPVQSEIGAPTVCQPTQVECT
jgi:hypothetical protein